MLDTATTISTVMTRPYLQWKTANATAAPLLAFAAIAADPALLGQLCFTDATAVARDALRVTGRVIYHPRASNASKSAADAVERRIHKFRGLAYGRRSSDVVLEFEKSTSRYNRSAVQRT